MSLDVDEIITEVRNQLDEQNTEDISDADILSALNRGQRKATNIITRKYDSLFLMADESTTTTAGTQEYDIPAKAFGRRVEKVEMLENNIAWEVKRVGFHKTTQFETNSQVRRPYYYALKKNKIRLYPKPQGSQTIRIWYSEKPEDLVESQGRIVSYSDSTTDTITVDALGDDITTDTTDGFNAWVNVIDYTTGEVKGTMQVSAINTTTKVVTFKSSGLTRATVLGKTILTTLPTDITEDDYICSIKGTCVPEVPGAYADYVMQFAVVELRRRQGEDTTAEFAHLKELEDEVQSMWKGREASNRIRKSSGQWNRGVGSNLRRLLS
jgi:hypothetical protein